MCSLSYNDFGSRYGWRCEQTLEQTERGGQPGTVRQERREMHRAVGAGIDRHVVKRKSFQKLSRRACIHVYACLCRISRLRTTHDWDRWVGQLAEISFGIKLDQDL